MGRRAHPVFEHFTRGAKLANNSNRYEQSCNYCGAHFAQGRPSSLTKHLGSCPSIPQQTLNTVFIEQNKQQTAFGSSPARIDGHHSSFEVGDLQFLQQEIGNEFFGLDALANASLGQPFTHIDPADNAIDPQSNSSATSINNNAEPPKNGDEAGNIGSFDNDEGKGTTRHPNSTAISQPAKIRKTRGAFSDSRKQEVHEVRKIGACIRCRSLNKLCSTETPCEQCKKIAYDKGAIWQFGCIRIENGSIFKLLGMGIHTHMAASIKKGFEDTSVIGTNETLRIVHQNFPGCTLNVTAAYFKDAAGQFCLLVKDNPQSLSSEMVPYLGAVDTDVLFIPTVIREAVQILQQMDMDSTSRSNDLHMAITTWKATLLLAAPSTRWQLSMQTSSSDKSTTDGSGDAILARSRNTIVAQLCEAIEQLVDNQILTKLDRRLGNSKDRNKVELFLLVLISLHVAERYTWYFRFLQHNLDASALSLLDSWPSDLSPSTYRKQGFRLATLYNIWTHCRHIVPLTVVDSSGMMELKELEGVDSLLRDLFASSYLQHSNLEAMDRAEFDISNESSLDGKFWARLFLEKDEAMIDRMKKMSSDLLASPAIDSPA